MTGLRSAVIERLADLIAAVRRPHPVRVAIDGPDAAGKTTLADELAPPLARRGRPVVRASADGFQHPRAMRHQRGPESPDGYYHDAFDDDAVRSELLTPLGLGGNRRYRGASFDYRTDSPVNAPQQEAPIDAVLLFDGVFLLRPELLAHWDVRIYVTVDPEETLRRAMVRDLAAFGGADAVRARYEVRYLPAQRMYRATARPEECADVVVENNDPGTPICTVRRRPV